MERKQRTHRQTSMTNRSMVLDDTDSSNGMMATNGHSLYRSRQTIFDSLDKILKCQGVCSKLFTIADIGTADGRTSLNLINYMIERIKQSAKNRPIMIYHTDQPGNDFNLLFSVLQGTKDTVVSGLQRSSDIFNAAISRTMYEQNLPDESVDLIFSSVAAMALSKRPCIIEGGISCFDGNEVEKELMKQQFRKDWKQFLYLRGKELRKGGYMIVLNIGMDKTGKVVEPINGGYATFSKILHFLLEENFITKEEFLKTYHNGYFQGTEKDHSYPFDIKDEDLMSLGLELVSVRSFVNYLQHWTFNILDKDSATKQEYANRVIAGIKPYLYNTIFNGLSQERSEDERHKIVDLYFRRMWEYSLEHHHSGTVMPLVEVVVRREL